MREKQRCVTVIAAGVFAACGAAVAGACGTVEKVRSSADANSPVDVDPMVTVRAVRKTGPILGVPVIFRDPMGNELATLATDAMGEVRYPMPTGGSVTVIAERALTGTQDELITYLGVMPGDVLQTGHFAPQFDTTPVTIAFPPVAEGSRFVVATSCGPEVQVPAAPTPQIPLARDCSQLNLVATVLGPTLQPVGSLRKSAIAIGPNQPIDLSTERITPLANRSLTVTNPPSALQRVTIDLAMMAGRLTYPHRISTAVDMPPGGVAISGPLTGDAEANELVQITASRGNTWETLTAVRPPNAPRTIDFAAQALGPLLTAPVFDASDNAVRWVRPAGPAADAAVTSLTVTRTAAQTTFAHTVVAPATEDRVRLPSMPELFARYRPDANDAVTINQIVLHRVDAGGYHALRSNLLAQSPLEILRGSDFTMHSSATLVRR